MQTFTWYVRRLRQMDAAEIVWRGRNAWQEAGARLRFSLGLTPSLLDPPTHLFATDAPWPPLCPVPPGAFSGISGGTRPAWMSPLLASADDLIAHRFSFLNLKRVDLGDPINWNCDHEIGMNTPIGYTNAIDYRDTARSGDAKMVWEPSRHLHLAVLGRAYRATGDVSYARAALAHLDSWMTGCPFGTGMNWRSPLELAIRAINWSWAIALIGPAGVMDAAARRRVLHALDCFVQDVSAKYSRGSSANNHRIGEAAGVFVATSCCPTLTDASRLRSESFAILCDEIVAQNNPDGGNREQAFSYHLFVLQFFLAAAHVAAVTRQPFPDGFRDRLAAMVNFADVLTAAGPAPYYGDDDEGYVLDLGGRDRTGRELVAIGRVLLGQSPREYCEPLTWLFGTAPDDVAPSSDALASHAFPDTGLYLLQWGQRGADDSASLTFDCGELGFGPLAAHGHADALSITLRALGTEIFVDPGTFDYFRHPAWRDYFRSTRAHNTVVVDDLDQSVMLGPFMWGERASARCLEWRANGSQAIVSGEHDGYTRLASPVRHRRTVEMDASARTFVVTDAIEATGAHRLALPFHLAEDAVVTDTGPHTLTISVARGTVQLSLDPRLDVSLLHGSEHPIAGWVSRGYHVKTPSTTVIAAATISGPVTLATRITVCPSAR